MKVKTDLERKKVIVTLPKKMGAITDYIEQGPGYLERKIYVDDLKKQAIENFLKVSRCRYEQVAEKIIDPVNGKETVKSSLRKNETYGWTLDQLEFVYEDDKLKVGDLVSELLKFNQDAEVELVTEDHLGHRFSIGWDCGGDSETSLKSDAKVVSLMIDKDCES